MKVTTTLLASCAALALASSGLSQGADLCTNAQAIVGVGMFNFDNSLATTDGTPDPLCLAFGNDDIDSDVWFSWVAPNSGLFAVSTCGQTAVDTKLGIYDGSCMGAVVACNDDACGTQSEASWAAVAGQIYVIRLGTYPGAIGGTGSFTLTENLPTLNPANGFHYRSSTPRASPGTRP